MVSPMDAAWSILKADPRTQAFSFGVQPGALQHPDIAPFPQTRLRNLGTVDPNVVSMALQQANTEGYWVPPVRDFMVDASEIPIERRALIMDAMPLQSERDYGGAGGGFTSMLGDVGDGVPHPMAISRAPRPYHGATFDVSPFTGKSGATLAARGSPQGIIDDYFNHFGRNPTPEEMAGLVPNKGPFLRYNINRLFPEAIEASRFPMGGRGNPDNIRMLPGNIMQQV